MNRRGGGKRGGLVLLGTYTAWYLPGCFEIFSLWRYLEDIAAGYSNFYLNPKA
ncbi:MAG: hypothetical protein ABFS45_06445 [Pseudomonadota bacterium]